MRDAHPHEASVGIAYYVSDTDGIGGRLRDAPEDFRVDEIEAVECEPIDADPGAYPHVVVRATLRGWATSDFAGRVANRLGMSRERITWAGTKDRDAVTTQLFSIRDPDPDAVAALSIENADLTVCGRTGRPVLFGDLVGNRFEIVVRDAADGVGAITDELAAFAEDGESGDESSDATRTARVAVPNWFGQQRFGSRRAITHRVGLAIVRDDWRGAVRAVVGRPSEREPERTQRARETADQAFERLAAGEDPDWADALDAMPGHLGQERAMLQRCRERDADSPADFQSAVETAPESLQRLYVHAAQSWLFNRMLSARLERGLPFDRPVEGDVVAFGTEREGVFVPDTDRTQRVTADRVATIERHCERGRAVVTHPLVGTATDLAAADTAPGDIERAILDDADLAPAEFAGPDPFGSTGDRRAIRVATDLAVETDAADDPELRFALPKGSYATAIVREYCKVDPDRL